MKKLLLSILTAILLLFSVLLISCGEDVTTTTADVTTTTATDVTTTEPPIEIKAEDSLWYPKWNAMVKAKTLDVNLLKLGTKIYHSSDLNDLVSVSVTDNGDIEALIGALSSVEFEAVDNSEFTGKSGITAVIVNDITEVKDPATNEPIYDETDTDYAYAVEVFITFDGEVYIIYTPDSAHRAEHNYWMAAPGEGKILFKSKTTVDYELFDSIRDDNLNANT